MATKVYVHRHHENGDTDIYTDRYRHWPFYREVQFDVPEGRRLNKPVHHFSYERDFPIELKTDPSLSMKPRGSYQLSVSSLQGTFGALQFGSDKRNHREEAIRVFSTQITASDSFEESVSGSVDNTPYYSFGARPLFYPRDMSNSTRDIAGFGTNFLFGHICEAPLWLSVDSRKFLRGFPWRAYSQEVAHEIRPSLNDGGFSLANFVVELKELKTLFEGLMTLLRYPSYLKSKIRREMRRTRRPFASAFSVILSELSGRLLEFSFGLIPFMSDLQEICTRLVDAEKLYTQFIGFARTPVTRHRSVTSTASLGHLAPLIGTRYGIARLYGMDVEWYQTTGFSSGTEPKYTGSTYYHYDIDSLGPIMDRIRGYLDIFGVARDPSILWNAVPFSFVIDWIFDVGGYLRNMRIDNLEATVTLDDFCASNVLSITRETWVRGDFGRNLSEPDQWAIPSYFVPLTSERLKIYGRWQHAPPDYTWEPHPTLNIKRMILGLALVQQNRRKIASAFGYLLR